MTDTEDFPGDDNNDCVDEVVIPEGSDLEAICKHYGLKYFLQAQMSQDSKGYFNELRRHVEREYVRQRDAHDSVSNFFIESWRFYRRHVEDDNDKAVLCAMRDTMQYLSLLKNDFPLRTRVMRDEW